jgi:hypothetical protein
MEGSRPAVSVPPPSPLPTVTVAPVRQRNTEGASVEQRENPELQKETSGDRLQQVLFIDAMGRLLPRVALSLLGVVCAWAVTVVSSAFAAHLRDSTASVHVSAEADRIANRCDVELRTLTYLRDRNAGTLRTAADSVGERDAQRQLASCIQGVVAYNPPTPWIRR